MANKHIDYKYRQLKILNSKRSITLAKVVQENLKGLAVALIYHNSMLDTMYVYSDIFKHSFGQDEIEYAAAYARFITHFNIHNIDIDRILAISNNNLNNLNML